MRRRNVKDHRMVILLYVILQQDTATTNLCHILSFLFNLVYYFYFSLLFESKSLKLLFYIHNTHVENLYCRKESSRMKNTHLPEESKEPTSPRSSQRDHVLVEKQSKTATKTCLPETTVLSGRERLKRHRDEVAGKVPIPDSWGKEGLLMGWMDFSAFDAAFTSSQIVSARAALMADAGDDAGARGSRPQRLRVESSC
ncbi:PREDICTED: uncharacterized protein LOC104790697 [Camelina sativa]|uniref:Uncharacterized protein LOC104790697 n=1 Tax=Camelina sativa TaxID=90675 RepID=A0ABM0ZEV8_CAMSA|nr:PREDICTED: uncharacterized protein LOC104790697 [Camelina sativa]